MSSQRLTHAPSITTIPTRCPSLHLVPPTPMRRDSGRRLNTSGGQQYSSATNTATGQFVLSAMCRIPIPNSVVPQSLPASRPEGPWSWVPSVTVNRTPARKINSSSKPAFAALVRAPCKRSIRHCDGLARLFLLCASTFRHISWIIYIIQVCRFAVALRRPRATRRCLVAAIGCVNGGPPVGRVRHRYVRTRSWPTSMAKALG
jgi:hypothetical protein